LKSQPLAELALKAMQVPDGKITVEDQTMKGRVITRAMKAGLFKSNMFRLRRGKHYTLFENSNGQEKKGILPSDSVRTEMGLLVLNTTLKGFVRWLLREGVDWDVELLMEPNSINNQLMISNRCILVAKWEVPALKNHEYRFDNFHVERNREGRLLGFWESQIVPKVLSGSDGKKKWNQIIRNAIRAGQSTAMICCLYEEADYFVVKTPKRFTEEFTEQIVPMPGRSFPNHFILEEGMQKTWALGRNAKEMVEWLRSQEMQWFLSFEKIKTESGYKLSDFAYLTVYCIPVIKLE